RAVIIDPVAVKVPVAGSNSSAVAVAVPLLLSVPPAISTRPFGSSVAVAFPSRTCVKPVMTTPPTVVVGGCVTTIAALPAIAPDDAVTVPAPTPTARMKPPLPTPTDEDHATTFVTSAVVPSLNVPVAA